MFVNYNLAQYLKESLEPVPSGVSFSVGVGFTRKYSAVRQCKILNCRIIEKFYKIWLLWEGGIHVGTTSIYFSLFFAMVAML